MFNKSILTLVFLLSFALVSSAQVPQYINYQGQLNDSGGNPLTGNYSINFRIYSASSGGSLLWGPQTYTIFADDGLFSVALGAINYSVFDGNDKWLSIQVGSDPEMTPRKRLVSVGYSFRAYDADKVDGKDASAFIQAGQANSISTVMIQSNAVTASKISPKIVSSVDGVSNDGGNIDLVAGSNITITPNNGNNTITIKSTGGGDNDWTISGSNMYSAVSGKVGIGNSNPAKKLDVGGSFRASGSIVTTGSYVVAGAPSSSYNAGDLAATNDVLADDNIIAKNGYIRTGTPSTAHGAGDIVATDDLYADDRVTGNNGVWGYNSSTRYGYLGGSGGGAYGQSSNSSIYGKLGAASPARGVYGQNSSRWGYIGGSTYAGYFSGNVRVTGSLSKGSGSFQIDHPLDPANKYLFHSFVESPDMMNIYNGNVKLDGNGEAWVDLPDWFQALNKENRYQLTPVGAPGPNLYIAKKISNNRFKIAGGNPGMEVSWQVTGIRQDAFANAQRIPVEVEKTAKERGKFLYPKAHGMPISMGMDYEEWLTNQESVNQLNISIQREKEQEQEETRELEQK